MAILFDESKKTFTLHTDHSTYQMQVDRFGYLLHLYYGRRSEGCMDYLLQFADRGFSGNPYDAGLDRTYSLDVLPQEFPVQGSGDYRSTLLSIRDESGAWGCDLRYRGHRIESGKYALPGLPAVYAEAEEDESETLRIELKNERSGVRVTLLYGVLPRLDILTRSAIVTNEGSGTVTVDRLGSACLDFVSGDFDLLSFYGRHALERQLCRRPVEHGLLSVGSRRGYSSHHYNPFVILCDRDATETSGRCWAMQYVYSGGFRADCERDGYEQTRLSMSLAEEKFAYPLAPGESLTAPEVILTYSDTGLETISHNLHRCLQKHVCRGKYRDAVRPILLNSWEASYFDFSGESLLRLADEAKALGVEMLVMDDGWFGARRDDCRALGDWTANEEKLGGSLGDLIRAVNQRGLKFGIWMEPEMVSEDSELYRAHPDWALAIPGEKPQRSRYQLVLDLSRREVCEEIYKRICAVLDQGNIEYLKWDVNRSIAEAFSHEDKAQGRVLYDYMLGLYDILERLVRRYPDLLIEGCSGGGGRFDAGMLYYSPQIWCSDNTDAVNRLSIQYGTSFGYPISAMGSHVSACPNHQTGRTTPLSTRGTVAMSGTFGFELDPAKLSEEEKREVRRQIAAFKADAALIHGGLYYRLSDPGRERVGAWEFAAEDGSEALVCAVLQEIEGNMTGSYLRPRGLTPGALYRCREDGRTYPAAALMDMGFPLPLSLHQYESLTRHFERV